MIVLLTSESAAPKDIEKAVFGGSFIEMTKRSFKKGGTKDLTGTAFKTLYKVTEVTYTRDEKIKTLVLNSKGLSTTQSTFKLTRAQLIKHLDEALPKSGEKHLALRVKKAQSKVSKEDRTSLAKDVAAMDNQIKALSIQLRKLQDQRQSLTKTINLPIDKPTIKKGKFIVKKGTKTKEFKTLGKAKASVSLSDMSVKPVLMYQEEGSTSAKKLAVYSPTDPVTKKKFKGPKWFYVSSKIAAAYKDVK